LKEARVFIMLCLVFIQTTKHWLNIRRAQSTTGKMNDSMTRQATNSIHRVTTEYLWPYKEDVMRFDFEVDQEDEYMCHWIAKAHLSGITTSTTTNSSDINEVKVPVKN
jgi:hypothetical protein